MILRLTIFRWKSLLAAMLIFTILAPLNAWLSKAYSKTQVQIQWDTIPEQVEAVKLI